MGVAGIVDGDGQGLGRARTTAGSGATRRRASASSTTTATRSTTRSPGSGTTASAATPRPSRPAPSPADAANEFTFASLRNIAGFPGEPILFRVDDSWRQDVEEGRTTPASATPHPKCARPKPPARPAAPADPRVPRASSTSIKPVEPRRTSPHLPPVTHDWVVARRDRSQEFVTSEPVHELPRRAGGPVRAVDVRPAGKTAGVRRARAGTSRPHGEWRWTPMGLAGRDPIFHAQVESEIRLDRRGVRLRPGARRGARRDAGRHLPAAATGRWASGSSTLDHPGGRRSSRSTTSTRSPARAAPGHGDAKYGALARDGVSCVVCHRMQPQPQPADDHRPYLQFFLETSITGNFHLGTKGEIYGPFKDDEIAPYAMEHATGLKPKHSDFLKSSQLCGTCHTVALPTIDQPARRPRTRPVADELRQGRDGRRCSASSTTTSSRRPTWSGSTASTRTRSTRRTRRRSRARTATWRAG